MTRGNAVHGVGVIGNFDSPTSQLIAKSYRPRSSRYRKRGQLAKPLAKLVRGGDQRLPEPFAAGGVERGKNLATARIEDRQALLPRAARSASARPRASRVQTPDSGQAGAGGQPTRGREADADADERAGPRPTASRPTALPAAAGLDRPLDLGQQRGGVTWAAVRREPEQLLVRHLAGAHRADGGVGGRRVEADDRLPLRAQLSQ